MRTLHDEGDNAIKVAYLAEVYEKKSLKEIVELFQLPILDKNCAIWRASDLGFISFDEKTYTYKTLKPIYLSHFYEIPSVLQLVEDILYILKKLSKHKSDIEETTLTQWLQGYPPQDVLIAIQLLLRENIRGDKLISCYSLKDDGNDYTFYTLTQNLKKAWGKKQFKVKPKANPELTKPKIEI
jgi:hypothetical protein